MGHCWPMLTGTHLQRFCLVVAGVLLIAGASLGEPAQAESAPLDCIDDWSEASRIVDRENLAGIGAVARTSHAAGHGGLLSTKLCQVKGAGAGGEYVYAAVVREKSGRLKRVLWDARTLRPFGP